MSPRSTIRENSWTLSAVGCVGALLFFVGTDSTQTGETWHWMLAPLLLCGILVGEDAVRWLRGEMDVFDPIGLMGLYGVHFFFLAPLLHLRWGYWVDIVPPPTDWRAWLGGMASLNACGLVVYRVTRTWWTQSTPRIETNTGWRLEPHRVRWALMIALPIAAALQLYVYSRYGGLLGYIQAVESEQHAFLGVNRIAIISDAFPILLLIAYVIWNISLSRKPDWLELATIGAGFLMLKLLFGGLHGSRSNVIYAVYWGVGVVHLGLRPISRKLLVGAAAVLLGFVYFYGFYKSAGVDGLRQALESSSARTALEQEIRRPLAGALLGDLGRSDIQALMLYQIMRRDSDYELAYGRTYYGAAVTPIPGPLWRNRPPTKVKEGTDLLYGRDSYRDRALSSTIESDRFIGKTSKVFGLSGEVMLNFGPFAVPFAFVFLGIAVGWTHCQLRDWSVRDPRRLFLPVLANLCMILLYADSDNILAYLEGVALFPFLIVYWSSFAIQRSAPPCIATGANRIGGTADA